MSKARQKREPVAQQTYFVVVTFREVKGSGGKLTAEDPREARNREHALNLVERYKPLRPGVIAFYRTCDPASGEWEDAVIIARHGRVPEEVDGLVDATDIEADNWAISQVDLKVA